MPAQELLSTEPATGAVLWRQPVGDVDVEVAHARRSWADWAARPLAYRIEAPAQTLNRQELAEAFTGLLTPQDAGRWRPHVTVQNKVQPSLAKVVLAALSRDFAPREVEIAGLASWWYRGGPWELHARHMFA